MGDLHGEEPGEDVSDLPEATSENSDDAPKSPEAGSTKGDLKRSLLRKVAQLTRVVAHLNSKSDEQELEYARFQEETEEKIRRLYEDAAQNMEAEIVKLQELASKTCLQENSARLESLFGQQRAEFATEVRTLKATARGNEACVVAKADSDLGVSIQQVKDISHRVRQSVDAYRATLQRRAAEMEQRNEASERTENIERERESKRKGCAISFLRLGL